MVNADPVLVVKSINVERGSTDGSSSASAAPAMGMNPSLASRYGMPPGMAARYGMGAAVAAGPKPGEAPLDDKPIRVTLNIDVVKLPPDGAAKPGPAKTPKKG